MVSIPVKTINTITMKSITLFKVLLVSILFLPPSPVIHRKAKHPTFPQATPRKMGL